MSRRVSSTLETKITIKVGRLGFEPRTNGLKVHCSTIELAAQGENPRGLALGGLRESGIAVAISDDLYSQT